MFRSMTYVSLVAVALVLGGCKKKSEGESEVAKTSSVGKAVVELKTSEGLIVLELDGEKAPKTVSNFLEYAKAGFYDGTIFHRVIDGFMIQGGGFDKEMNQKPTRAPIENEGSNGLSNLPMTIAMARTNDPNSATAQFFINLVDNSRLDFRGPQSAGYAVFGKVIEGEDIVKKIGKAPTGNQGMFQDVPNKTIVIESAKVR